MKRPILLTFLIFVPACEKQESLIRPEAANEIAENMGKAMEEELETRSLEIAISLQKGARRQVELASTPQEIALAAEELRMANDEVTRIERKIESLR